MFYRSQPSLLRNVTIYKYNQHKFNNMRYTLDCEEVLETEISATLRGIDDGLIHGRRKAGLLKEDGNQLGLNGLALFLIECSEW